MVHVAGQNRRNNWTEEETILAFYYYCQMPFGKIHTGNPEIIRIAKLIGRSPGAVSFKMGNLAHFDPQQQKRNVNGLKNASKLDEKVVKEFLDNWEELSFRAVIIEERLEKASFIDVADMEEILPVGEDAVREKKQRINQEFFREAVLVAYGNRCCISGIAIPSLLIASHIKPWAISDPKTERTNPCNGLSLNALHDKAFDRGLITVLPDYTVRVSSQLKMEAHGDGLEWLKQYDRQKIIMPDKFVPHKDFLEYHNDMIFIP